MSDDLIVGIDLGTTNSAIAVVQHGQPRLLSRGGDKLLPSVVGYTPDGQWLVGRPALNQYTLHPEQTVRSIKRKMGTSETVTLGGEDFTPEAISAFILRELKAIAEENLGQSVTKAVITVPAYFTDAQRRATRAAGEIAGLEVVRIINEPTAAALAYGMHHTTDQTALVYDLGGGTFDVSLVEMMDGIVEVQASHGDTHLGGDDFDRLLADHARAIFNEMHQFSLADNRLAMARLTAAAEAAKIQLSSVVDTPIREEYLAERGGVSLHLDTMLTRSDFEQLVTPLVERTLRSIEQVLADAELTTADIERVLFVGGSTRIPLVWEIVANYTGLEPEVEINPDEAVALGAAIQAAIIAGQPIEAILVDVTPYSLGIETAVRMGGYIIPDVYEVLIHRNTTIPVTSEKIFSTLHPDQDAIHLKVYQGEQPQASSNVLLGDFMVEDLKAAEPGRTATVTVRFDFDVNGMLHVQATDRATGQQHSISVEAAQSRMSPQDIAQARLGLPGGIEVIPATEHQPPAIDSETQALLDRAQVLLESNRLSLDETASLQTLVADIKSATNQEVFDDLAEALLEMLFELEE